MPVRCRCSDLELTRFSANKNRQSKPATNKTQEGGGEGNGKLTPFQTVQTEPPSTTCLTLRVWQNFSEQWTSQMFHALKIPTAKTGTCLHNSFITSILDRKKKILILWKPLLLEKHQPQKKKNCPPLMRTEKFITASTTACH